MRDEAGGQHRGVAARLKLLVDSTVWADYLRGTRNTGARLLDRAIGNDGILAGDLILAEVLRGVQDEKVAKLVQASLERSTS